LAVTPDRDGIGGVDHELAAQKVGHLWYHDPHHVEPERDHHIVRALDRVTIVLRCRALDPPGRRFRLGGYEDADRPGSAASLRTPLRSRPVTASWPRRVPAPRRPAHRRGGGRPDALPRPVLGRRARSAGGDRRGSHAASRPYPQGSRKALS